ncbi:MAG: hypothetical protein K6A82_09515 [Prevotella sp.]|nr:hypothetical protein [Prevotella sp.]
MELPHLTEHRHKEQKKRSFTLLLIKTQSAQNRMTTPAKVLKASVTNGYSTYQEVFDYFSCNTPVLLKKYRAGAAAAASKPSYTCLFPRNNTDY